MNYGICTRPAYRRSFIYQRHVNHRNLDFICNRLRLHVPQIIHVCAEGGRLMSALAVFVQPGVVHLISDGAAYDKDGLMLRFMQKIVPMPNLGVAVAGRGNVAVLADIMAIVSCFSSLDELKANLPAALLEAYGEHVKANPDHFHFDLVIAGHYGGNAVAWLISSWDQHAPAFELCPIQHGWYSPAIEEKVLQQLGTLLSRDPCIAAAAVLRSQRTAGDNRVGGYGQLMTISRAGFNTRLVCRWADKVGEKIGVEAKSEPVWI